MNPVRKTRLVLRGLYIKNYLEYSFSKDFLDAAEASQQKAWQTIAAAQRRKGSSGLVEKHLREIGTPIQSYSEHLNGYRSGPKTLEMKPTYQMDEKKFLQFLRQFEAKIKALRTNGQASFDAAGKFFDTYSEVFHVLFRMSEFEGMTYFNLMFYPRAGHQQKIFRRFINCYLDAVSPRMNMQGPKSGTQAIPAQALLYAENLRRKGKGTKVGSIETLTSETLKRIGYTLNVDATMQDDETLDRRREATRRTLLRHFKRKQL